MEAVSAGAGVLTFITVALQSTKKVYEAVSDIKNGPQLVENLASAVTNLQSVLTQLSNCTALTSTDSETDLGGILGLIKTCSQDVSCYEKELGKVRASPDDKRVGRAWKKFMAILHEKDFQRMWVGVTHHVSALGVHLDLIQSNTGLISKRKLVHLNEAISKQAGNDQTQMALLHHQSAELSIIKDTVNSVNDVSLSIQGQIRDTVAPLFQRMEQAAGVSATQYENISVLLQALQHQVSGLVNHSSHREPVPHREPPGFDSSGSTDSKADSQPDHELLNRIGRLCQLAKQKEGQKYDNEAEGIIDDLDALLKSVSLQLSHSSSEYRPSRKRPVDVVQEEGNNNGRQLKRIRGLLTSSDSVMINQKAPRYPSFRNGKIIGQCNMKEFQTAYGKFIMTTKRRQWFVDRGTSRKGTTNSKTTGELTATCKAILDHERFQANVTVYINQRTRADRFSSLYPSILVGRIWADDSPIFSFVETGNMDGLLNLLRQNKASLRDTSCLGTPLLHYATSQPEMCKFLIENGADVDEIAPFDLIHSQEIPGYASPLWVGCYDRHLDEEGRSRRNECWRLLLTAGADPDPDPDPDTENAYFLSGLKEVVTSGTVEPLRAILDLGTSFIDLERKDERGATPLLKLALGEELDPAMFDLLLRRGSDIEARDNEGKNCLHLCISRTRLTKDSNAQEALVLLIRKGADVNAVDNYGNSVSKTAYSYDSLDEIFRHGSFRGDLWDAVLSECGYNIAEMRGGFPRRPHYAEILLGGRVYTRKDFERLWRGREEFCPYYNDPPEWDPKGALDSPAGSKKGIPENGSEGVWLDGYSGYSADNNEEDTQHELPPLRDDGQASVFWAPSLPPYSDHPAVWNSEGDLESFERSEECPQKGMSASPELQAGSGYDMDHDEEGTEHEIPPLRNSEDGNMLWRQSLTSLSSMVGATMETSTIEPATSSSGCPYLPQTIYPRNDFQQARVESNTPESVPGWQAWPTTLQTTFPAHSFQRGFVSAVSELEESQLEEPNPWL